MPFVKKYGIFMFMALLLAHLYCIYIHVSPWRTVSKLLLVPFLLLYLFASRERPVSKLVVYGLLCSFAGDLLLAFPGEGFFIPGMLVFICTHTFNFRYFARLQKSGPPGGWGTMAGMAGFMIVLGSYVMFSLFRRLGSLQAPVTVYMLVITAMAIAAGTARNAAVKKISLQCFIPGAALFALSDGILAMNRFAWHETIADMAVMATYGIAQLLLVSGFVRITQLKDEVSKPDPDLVF